jgi:hypothetical protein
LVRIPTSSDGIQVKQFDGGVVGGGNGCDKIEFVLVAVVAVVALVAVQEESQ